MIEQLSFLTPHPPRPSFHQRRPISGPAHPAAAEIASGERKAQGLKARIWGLFAVYQEWTCGQAWEVLAANGAKNPPHSIKPRFDTLAKENKIKMTERRIMGPFGRPEHVWVRIDGRAEMVR